MTILNRILKKLRRRRRPKGIMRQQMNRRGRNFQGLTAEILWERVYRFKETPPARAGTKRRLKRERKARSKSWSFF